MSLLRGCIGERGENLGHVKIGGRTQILVTGENM